jgi:hypothetical protein
MLVRAQAQKLMLGTAAPTAAITIDTSSNVGIGTVAPATNLHVYSGNATILTLERSSSQNAAIEAKSTVGSMFFGATNVSADFAVDDDNDLAVAPMFLVQRSTGYVGIGTASPSYKLDVVGGNTRIANGEAVLRMQNTGTTWGTDSGGFIEFYDNASRGGWLGYGGGFDGNMYLSNELAGKGIKFRTVAADRMIIDNTGSVGIGTMTPGQKLTVAGTIESTSGGVKFPDGTTQATAAVSGFANLIINGGFAVNQRVYTTGSALGAGAYGHDRWKGGASGVTYTFTQNAYPLTTVTVTAGSLVQVVEGRNVAGGNYTLSWSGTAQGRVNGAAYLSSPITVGLTAGANITVEFNTGTLGAVQLESGTAANAFTVLPYETELRRSQRYFLRNGNGITGNCSALCTQMELGLIFPVPMRTAPSLSLNSASATAYAGGGFSTSTGSASLSSLQTSTFDGATFILTGWPGNGTFDQRGARLQSNILDWNAEL